VAFVAVARSDRQDQLRRRERHALAAGWQKIHEFLKLLPSVRFVRRCEPKPPETRLSMEAASFANWHENTTSHSKFDGDRHDRYAVRDPDGINRSGTQTASRYRDPARQSGDPASGTRLSSNCPASEHRGRCSAPNPSGTRRDSEGDGERAAATSGCLFPLGAHSLEVQTFSYWPILSPDFLPAS
jgi:hypothetical protein